MAHVSHSSSHLLRGFLLVALAALSFAGFAQGVPTTAEMFGATPPTDKSVGVFTYLLGTFFTSPMSSIGGSPGLIGAMFLIFNGAIFLVGTIWACYGLLSGIVETAHRGEVLGKRLSAVWLPIRMVTGIAGIVPVFGGFSLAQVFIVTMTALGIGIGNMLWKGAVESTDAFSGLVPGSAAMAATGGRGFNEAAHTLFQMHVCRLAKRDLESQLSGAASVEPIVSLPITGALSSSRWGTQTNRALCGSAALYSTGDNGRSRSSATSFRVASVGYESYVRAVQQAYTGGFPSFDQAVSNIAGRWYAARTAAKANTGAPMPPYPEEEIAAAAQTYSMAVKAGGRAAADIQRAEGSATGGITSGAKRVMLRDGWFGAGAWFATFAEASAALTDAMRSIRFDLAGPAMSGAGVEPYVVEALEAISKSRSSSDVEGAHAGATKSGGGQENFAVVSSWLCAEAGGNCSATGNTSVGQWFVKEAIEISAIGSGGGGNGRLNDEMGLVNPIIMFKNLGDYMMGIGQTLVYGAALAESLKSVPGAGAAQAAAGALGDVASKVPGLGTVSKTVLGALDQLGKLIMIIAPYMIILGLLMAIYIPMIPFITWMGGLVQYCVVVLQGLVGAPIAALSHLEAEGEGLGQRTQAGYMFVLNVLFRPALMLFGFFFAAALMIALGSFQAALFMSAMANAQGNSMTGFLSIIGYLTLFFVLNVTLIQGLFNMIFLLPDQVLGMIGSHGAVADLGREVEGKMHGMFIGLGRNVQNVGGAFKERGAREKAMAREQAHRGQMLRGGGGKESQA
jgi:conjugal transfer/type IV secretion protein DotA/TraY